MSENKTNETPETPFTSVDEAWEAYEQAQEATKQARIAESEALAMVGATAEAVTGKRTFVRTVDGEDKIFSVRARKNKELGVPISYLAQLAVLPEDAAERRRQALIEQHTPSGVTESDEDVELD